MCGLVVLLFCGFVVRLLVKQKEEQESATASARFFTFHSSLFTKRKSNSNSSFFILHFEIAYSIRAIPRFSPRSLL